MKKMSKILIAYDGSGGADEMLIDLRRAGLPGQAEALVVSVSEAWFLLSGGFLGVGTNFVTESVRSKPEARVLAEQAGARIQADFPGWQVQSAVAVGSPAQVLLGKADEWQPDLLVLGSHGHTPAGRFFFGSVSQTVVTHAHCSVRVARAPKQEVAAPLRLIIGVDGSAGAEAAVRAVASRAWPQGTAVRVVSAFQLLALATDQTEQYENAALQMSEWMAGAKVKADEIATAAAAKLKAAGLDVAMLVREENPKRLLLAEAEEWGADCIFVGARELGRMERLWLGSVSTAVVMRAHCSVEVVRAKQ